MMEPRISLKGVEMKPLPCKFRGCENLTAEKCWWCGEWYCNDHLKPHERCQGEGGQRWKLCSKLRCQREHQEWCQKNLPYRAPLKYGKVLGSGSESVYVYYDRARFELARRRREKNWPCKIGRTNGRPDARIVTQGVATAFSDVPMVPLVFCTDDSANLENAIQAMLRCAGRRMRHFRGTEWYVANPEEIEDVYRLILRATRTLRKPGARRHS